MHKHGGNEHMISTKLKAVIDVVKDFAGRTTEADAAKAKAEAEKRDRGTLCGLTMMHKYKDDPENDSPRLQRSATMQGGSEPSTERRSPNASDTEGTNRGTERGHVPKRGVAADPTTSASVAALAFAQSKDVERTVAEEYIIRSEQAKGRSREAIRKIAKSRRRYLWLGIGEGMKKMRATTLAQMEQQYLADSNRHKTRTLSKLSGVSKSSKGTSEEESESAEESGRKAKAKAEAQEDEDEEELAAQEEEDEVGDDDLKGLILWTTQAKKLKHSREAMSLAAGPATKAIGALTPEVQKRRLEELGRKYLDEYHLHHDVNTQLHDMVTASRALAPRAHGVAQRAARAHARQAQTAPRLHQVHFATMRAHFLLAHGLPHLAGRGLPSELERGGLVRGTPYHQAFLAISRRRRRACAHAS